MDDASYRPGDQDSEDDDEEEFLEPLEADPVIPINVSILDQAAPMEHLPTHPEGVEDLEVAPDPGEIQGVPPVNIDIEEEIPRLQKCHL